MPNKNEFNGLEHRHGKLLAADVSRREQRMPSLEKIEAALEKHDERAHDGAERADEHDGPEPEEEVHQAAHG